MDKLVKKYFNNRAAELAANYDQLDRAAIHEDLLPLLPEDRRLKVLDIGAGSGADARMFAAAGHDVLAAEPAEKLGAYTGSGGGHIMQNNDALPDMKKTTLSGEKFDVVISVAALQYLDKKAREKSLKKIFSLVAKGGLVEIQYPTPPSREYQYEVGASEVTDFVKTFNAATGVDRLFGVVVDKYVPDSKDRRALNGAPLFHKTVILKRVV